jgi:predicted transcriptional regulator
MDLEEQNQELLTFFKALAEPNRLKIIGLLAKEELSVEQLAEMLGIKPPTVTHHLNKLSKAGLVSARSESYYSIYQLEVEVLEKMAKKLLKREDLPAAAGEVDRDAYDQKVIKTYTLPDGSIRNIPMQQKKLLVILRHVLKAFEHGRRYSEKEVNDILSRFNEDYALLRRELVEFGFMQRQGGGGNTGAPINSGQAPTIDLILQTASPPHEKNRPGGKVFHQEYKRPVNPHLDSLFLYRHGFGGNYCRSSRCFCALFVHNNESFMDHISQEEIHCPIHP